MGRGGDVEEHAGALGLLGAGLTLEDLGNLGDFIGGIAVILTLVYLAVQVRQNTAALKAASRQDIVAGFREHNRLSFQPGLDGVMRTGVEAFPDLPREQSDLFAAVMVDHVLSFQAAFALYEAGTLEDETYQAYLDYLAAWLITPGGAAWWRGAAGFLPPRMVAALDERVARGGLHDLVGLDVFRAPAPADPSKGS